MQKTSPAKLLQGKTTVAVKETILVELVKFYMTDFVLTFKINDETTIYTGDEMLIEAYTIGEEFWKVVSLVGYTVAIECLVELLSEKSKHEREKMNGK
jgi:hypothetical protein